MIARQDLIFSSHIINTHQNSWQSMYFLAPVTQDIVVSGLSAGVSTSVWAVSASTVELVFTNIWCCNYRAWYRPSHNYNMIPANNILAVRGNQEMKLILNYNLHSQINTFIFPPFSHQKPDFFVVDPWPSLTVKKHSTQFRRMTPVYSWVLYYHW